MACIDIIEKYKTFIRIFKCKLPWRQVLYDYFFVNWSVLTSLLVMKIIFRSTIGIIKNYVKTVVNWLLCFLFNYVL